MNENKTYTVDQLNQMILRDDLTDWELVDACSFIDINYHEPVCEPPIDFLEECRKRWETLTSPFRTTVERKIGNTWYVIETECAGSEPLADKVKRLIFSEKGAICS